MATRARKGGTGKPASHNAARKATGEAGSRRGPASASEGGPARVRMYRQGLGDCFLITLPRQAKPAFHLMIDCGVILGTKDPGPLMERVVRDIVATTSGRVDVLVATHEHWDHISGFVQARELFTHQLKVDQVWLAWTEDPKDALAKKLRGERDALRLALSLAEARLRVAGNGHAVDPAGSVLDFFGAAGSTAEALGIVKGLAGPGTPPRYCRPTDDPVPLPGTDARVWVLGPPHNEKMIKKYNPSKSHPETYGIDAMNVFLSGMAPALVGEETGAPFDPRYQIPLEVAQQVPFFRARYWGEDADADDAVPDSAERDQRWRRIDSSWLDSSANLALQLDSATNNTCLVLAIELGNGDVLLFAADAQVGNWLSWQDLSWKVDGKTVTGPDLLRRTVFYKVGHHGSHNATLKEKGLEQMTGLQIAMIPVDHAMAVKKGWGKMPLPDLVTALNEVTHNRVLRIDQPVPPTLTDRVEASELFYEVWL